MRFELYYSNLFTTTNLNSFLQQVENPKMLIVQSNSYSWISVVPPTQKYFGDFDAHPNLLSFIEKSLMDMGKKQLKDINNTAKAYKTLLIANAPDGFYCWIPNDKAVDVLRYWDELYTATGNYRFHLIPNQESKILDIVNLYINGQINQTELEKTLQTLVFNPRSLVKVVYSYFLAFLGPHKISEFLPMHQRAMEFLSILEMPFWLTALSHLKKNGNFPDSPNDPFWHFFNNYYEKIHKRYPMLRDDYFNGSNPDNSLILNKFQKLNLSALAPLPPAPKFGRSRPQEKIHLKDVKKNPIWKYALDEEDREGQDETWVKPFLNYKEIDFEFLWDYFPLLSFQTQYGIYAFGQWFNEQIQDVIFWDGTEWVWDYPGQPDDFPLRLTTLITIENCQRTFLLDKHDSQFALPIEETSSPENPKDNTS